MEFTGNVAGISQDYETGKLILAFSVNEQAVVKGQYDSLKDLEKLDIKVVKYHKKRSLDANAYCWVLMTKIAQAVKSSKEEIYEEMLQKYGPFYRDENGYITITVKSGVDMGKIQGHWKHYKDNGKFASYLMIKGSSEYDSAEMAHFIDCIVHEAKELGIETETPDEIARMKALWGKRNENV